VRSNARLDVMTSQDNGPPALFGVRHILPAPYRFDLRHLLDDAADDG
jgi:hypothetical protein